MNARRTSLATMAVALCIVAAFALAQGIPPDSAVPANGLTSGSISLGTNQCIAFDGSIVNDSTGTCASLGPRVFWDGTYLKFKNNVSSYVYIDGTTGTVNLGAANGATALNLTTGAQACLGTGATDCLASAGQAQSAKILVGATSAGYASLYFASGLLPFSGGIGSASSNYTIRSDIAGQTEVNSGAGSLGLNITNVTKIAITGSLISATVPVRVTDSKTVGTITLSAGTGTATVASGATCVCSDISATPLVVRCTVSSTTLTAAEVSGTNVVAYICL